MQVEKIREIADALGIMPRLDSLQVVCDEALSRNLGRNDTSLAPLMGEKLRHVYTKTIEAKFPELSADAGDVLGIDTSIPPSQETWVQYTVEQYGYADWIDDDGSESPTSTMTMSKADGPLDSIGHEWSMTILELERAAAANLPLSTIKPRNARRTHAAKRNWVWLFGDSAKGMHGLCTHPNIPMSVAAVGASTSRLPDQKTNDEILADIATLIDTVPRNTRRQHYIAKVFVPLSFMQLCKNRQLTGGVGADGMPASLWGYIKNLYSGDDTGQGAVQFRILNECGADQRANPKSGVDDSGVDGDFLLACPPDSEDNQFVASRPYTQLPPQPVRMKMLHMTHSKFGGARIMTPIAFHVLRFGV